MSDQVNDHLATVASTVRRRDADTLLELMRKVTGQEARMWGTVIGFGQYHYRNATGREGDAAAAGFAPRKAATTVYVLDGVDAHRELLGRLGPHTTGVGCIYIKDLDTVDLDVLEAIIRRSYATLTAGVHASLASEQG